MNIKKVKYYRQGCQQEKVSTAENLEIRQNGNKNICVQKIAVTKVLSQVVILF